MHGGGPNMDGEILPVAEMRLRCDQIPQAAVRLVTKTAHTNLAGWIQ